LANGGTNAAHTAGDVSYFLVHKMFLCCGGSIKKLTLNGQ